MFINWHEWESILSFHLENSARVAGRLIAAAIVEGGITTLYYFILSEGGNDIWTLQEYGALTQVNNSPFLKSLWRQEAPTPQAVMEKLHGLHLNTKLSKEWQKRLVTAKNQLSLL
jgi:hypothetical protein